MIALVGCKNKFTRFFIPNNYSIVKVSDTLLFANLSLGSTCGDLVEKQFGFPVFGTPYLSKKGEFGVTFPYMEQVST